VLLQQTGYRQKADFTAFPGPVVATTNCVLDPPKAYKDRMFTVNEVGVGVEKVSVWPLVTAAGGLQSKRGGRLANNNTRGNCRVMSSDEPSARGMV
jgi:hydroxylamine reductase (hybrid-cluster protein)